MGHIDHKEQSPEKVTCAVLVISDSRTEKTDESGKLLLSKLGDAGHKVSSFSLLKNETGEIRQKIDEFVNQSEVQVIVTSGGTGASRRDITIETVTPLLDKRLDGFGELFRSLSYQEIGTSCILSRALAGVIRGKVIICLPGSLGATRLALDKIILPEIGHMVREASR